MKIVVIGGSGLIGTKIVEKLHQYGHQAVAASPSSGVNTMTGEGLSDALADAEAVIDAINSPASGDNAVVEFFQTSTHNLLAAEISAGIRHHVLLSIVGTERLLESVYFRGKLAQEELVKKSVVPYTIVRSTQFFEFIGNFARTTSDGTIRLSPAYVQPISLDDAATALVDIAVEKPINGTLEIAGPVRLPLAESVQQYLDVKQDSRRVISDIHALYFGAELNNATLVPGDNARLGSMTFDDWLAAQSKV